MKEKFNNLDVKELNELIKVTKRVVKIFFLFIVLGLIVLGSYLLKDWGVVSAFFTILKIISPLFIGIVIAWLLDPAVRVLQKKGASRTISTIGVFVFFVFIILLFFWMVIPMIITQLQEAIGIVPVIIDNINKWMINFFENLTRLYEYDFTTVQNNIYVWFETFSKSITVSFPNFLLNLASSIFSGGVNFVVGMIIAFYMLFDFNNVRKELLNFLPKRLHRDTIELTDRLNTGLKNYVQGTLFVTLILFTFQSLAFSLVGLKAPLVFGLICAVTNIIPYIGPYLGGSIAVVAGFTMSPLIGMLSLIAVIISQFLESYILTPIVMSKTMKLHPVTIIIGLLLFGHFFGILGMILSTPIISGLKIIFGFLDEKFMFFKKLSK